MSQQHVERWWRLPVLSLVLLTIAVASEVSARGQSPTDRALALYNEAVRTTDMQERVRLLRASLAAFESFEGSVALGDTLLRTNGDPLEARRLCSRAFETLANPEAGLRRQAVALVCIARTYRATKERGHAIAILKRSLELERTEAAEQELRELLDTGMKRANEIANDIGRTAEKIGAPRGAVVTAATDIYVQFDYDKATLTPDGVAQVAELARALDMVTRSLSRAPILVIGHSDARGSDAYNDDLSLRRASTVKQELIAKHGVREEDIAVEGRGKRELLLTGTSEDDHRRNRRVEIQRSQ